MAYDKAPIPRVMLVRACWGSFAYQADQSATAPSITAPGATTEAGNQLPDALRASQWPADGCLHMRRPQPRTLIIATMAFLHSCGRRNAHYLIKSKVYQCKRRVLLCRSAMVVPNREAGYAGTPWVRAIREVATLPRKESALPAEFWKSFQHCTQRAFF